jgi:hypothetical protein
MLPEIRNQLFIHIKNTKVNTYENPFFMSFVQVGPED